MARNYQVNGTVTVHSIAATDKHCTPECLVWLHKWRH